MKLLIAYDGSIPANAALEELTEAGLPRSLQATVLSVADVWLPAEQPPADANLPDATMRSYKQALQAVETCQSMAESAAARLRLLFPEWKVEPQSCADSPPWAVVRRAKELGARLIVVGAHSHSVLERLFLGSVAARVLADAPCSVRIARAYAPARQQSPPRILIAVDGSNESVNAVQEVARRSWASPCEFRLVAVMDKHMESAVAWPDLFPSEWGREPLGSVAEWADRMMTSLAGQISNRGAAVTTHVHDGDPKSVILRLAKEWNVGCVFLGARGLHHGNRFFLGTVASAVAARAHCSVEVVRG